MHTDLFSSRILNAVEKKNQRTFSKRQKMEQYQSSSPRNHRIPIFHKEQGTRDMVHVRIGNICSTKISSTAVLKLNRNTIICHTSLSYFMPVHKFALFLCYSAYCMYQTDLWPYLTDWPLFFCLSKSKNLIQIFSLDLI